MLLTIEDNLLAVEFDGQPRITLTALECVEMFDGLEGALPQLVYPALNVVVVEQADDPDDTVYGLRCPHCFKEGVAVRTVDEAQRWTTDEDPDFKQKVVSFNYDSGTDFSGLYYACDDCGRPVDLPEGWEEV